MAKPTQTETEPETSLSDTPENANEEFGRGDQEFGGGAGEVEYGDQDPLVGSEGIVAEDKAAGRTTIVTDDEKEGVVLPGTDEPEADAADSPES